MNNQHENLEKNLEKEKYSTIVAYTYVARNLKTNPAKAIKFILLNREMFKTISDDTINQIKKERNITNDDINKIKIEHLRPIKKNNN